MAGALHRIEARILELAGANKRTWEELARLLLEVERRRLWQATAGSFTGWLHGVAQQADLQPSTLWRALKAGRIYLQLAGTDDPEAIRDLGVSAEALELADKITRHAPSEVKQQVVDGTLRGEQTVASLRSLWATYRPAAEGLTARGRLPDDEEAKAEAVAARQTRWEQQAQKPEVQEALVAGQILAALSDPQWVGAHDDLHVEAGVELDDSRLDAVVALRRDRRLPERLELQVVEIKGSRRELAKPMRCAKRGALAHRVWLAVAEQDARAARCKLSPDMGLLCLTAAGLRVARPAPLRRPSPSATAKLTSALLGRAYRWS